MAWILVIQTDVGAVPVLTSIIRLDVGAVPVSTSINSNKSSIRERLWSV